MAPAFGRLGRRRKKPPRPARLPGHRQGGLARPSSEVRARVGFEQLTGACPDEACASPATARAILSSRLEIESIDGKGVTKDGNGAWTVRLPKELKTSIAITLAEGDT
ncbi:MAG: hypothetical protein ACR2NU_02490 [Aeoliella sp.]